MQLRFGWILVRGEQLGLGMLLQPVDESEEEGPGLRLRRGP